MPIHIFLSRPKQMNLPTPLVHTCVKVEHASRLSLHGDGHIVPLDVRSADTAVGQLDLKQTAATLHAVQRQVIQTGLNVCLVGVEGLVEDILHDLQEEGVQK